MMVLGDKARSPCSLAIWQNLRVWNSGKAENKQDSTDTSQGSESLQPDASRGRRSLSSSRRMRPCNRSAQISGLTSIPLWSSGLRSPTRAARMITKGTVHCRSQRPKYTGDSTRSGKILGEETSGNTLFRYPGILHPKSKNRFLFVL